MWLVVWHSVTIICHINEVTLHQARLVLGWLTIFGWIYLLSIVCNQTIGSLNQVPAVLIGWS